VITALKKTVKPFYEFEIQEEVYDFSNYDVKHINYYKGIINSFVLNYKESTKRTYEFKKNLLAPHTSGPRDVPRCGALSLLQKDAALQGGVQQKTL